MPPSEVDTRGLLYLTGVFVLDWKNTAENKSSAKLLHEGEPPQNSNFVRKLLPGNERVLCLNEATGEVLWTHEYECPYMMVATYANGPRVTLAVDGGHVYSLGAESRLSCLRVEDGSVAWERDLRIDYG